MRGRKGRDKINGTKRVMKVKQEPLYVLLQPEIKHSYWSEQIREGIREGAREGQDAVCAVTFAGKQPELEGKYVLTVGNHIRWLEESVERLHRRGAHPVIVNAAMLPVRRFRCSGVLFELEEILGRCVEALADAGRKRTALLGVSRSSVTDQRKAEAFCRASGCRDEDVFWAEGRLEECVSRFAEGLEGTDYDAAICANDTTAVCLMHCLRRKGVVPPERLYVIGMGNSFVGAGMNPGLTSVMFDYHEMGVTAVRLYHNLRQSRTDCHMTVSLPCRLVARESAPLKTLPAGPVSGVEADAPPQDYFGGGEVQNIIRVETILQAGDWTDREILFGLMRGESSETMADRLFISDRAVRYRLSHILRQYDFASRAELEAALRRACGR